MQDSTRLKHSVDKRLLCLNCHPTQCPLRIVICWVSSSLHSARRRLPTLLLYKNSSCCVNNRLAMQFDRKNMKIYWEKTRNDRKYQHRNTNLILFNLTTVISQKFCINKYCFDTILYIVWLIYFMWSWSITSIGNAELLRCPMEYYRILWDV